MKLLTCLSYGGKCTDVSKRSEKGLGETIMAMTVSDTPSGLYKRPQGFSVSVTVRTKAEAEKLFNELANGGTVTMPLEATFWSAAFGMVTNRFGVPWMVNCEQTA